MAIFPGSAIPSAVSDYEIDNSVRFNAADVGYLSRNISSNGNRKTWTLSVWVKRGELDSSDTDVLLTSYNDANNWSHVFFTTDDHIRWQARDSGSNSAVLGTTAFYRDPSSWYHVVVTVDTTQGTDTNRCKIYVNGTLQDLSTTTYPSEDYESIINDASYDLQIGRYENSTGADFYLAEYYFIDGTALTPSSFGELDSTTNQWKPLDSDDVKDAVTFGTNGFYQKYNSTELATSFTDSAESYITEFTSTGTTTWTAPAGVTSVDYLVVAGGGAGGGDMGGGGGGGGVKTGTLSVTAGTSYTVTVGAGGTGASHDGSDGGDSVFSSVTATGGGKGGSEDGGTSNGSSGGSGGGGAGGGGSGGSGTGSEGNDGSDGQGHASDFLAGAGGGAGAAGGDYVDDDHAGNGGNGVQNNIDGNNYYYGAGGGGSVYNVSGITAGTGGLGGGGGGNGGHSATGGAGGTGGRNAGGAGPSGAGDGGDAGANTGSGGGGCGTRGSNVGGDGGSGIVIIKHTQSGVAPRHTITANGDVKNVRGADLDTTYANPVSFTSSTTWTVPTGVTSVSYLVVGGGGGGGGAHQGVGSGGSGGGGGSGGYRTGTLSVTPGASVTVTVGAGGSAGAANTTGGTGGDSVFSSITSKGGGGGGKRYEVGSDAPTGGGSGGGAGSSGNGTTSGGTGSTYGNNGGTNGGYGKSGGGGGGSAAVGSNAPSNSAGGAGGAGTSNDISGSSVTYAAGGTGGFQGNHTSGATGAANTGNGGGGGQGGNNVGGAGGSGIVVIAYDLAKPGSSSIEFDGTGDYLSVPDSDDWPNGTGSWTLEWWVNFDNSNDECRFIGQRVDDNNLWKIEKRAHDDPSGDIQLRWISGGSNVFMEDSGSLSWSSGTWYHMAVVKDGNDYEVFRDGVSIQTFTNSTSLDNYSAPLIIGQQSSGHYIDGYMDEIRISNTARYTSAFTPQRTQFTADSNTKLLIHSDYTGGLGADSSGNINDFTATNLVATDQCVDTPTNNFCTLSPIDQNGITLSQGNLEALGATGPWSEVRSSMGVSSGKWYWEVLYVSTAELEGWVAGIRSSRGALFQAHWYSGSWSTATNGHCYGLLDSGTKVSDGSSTSSFTSALSANDIIGFALDLDSGTTTLDVYVNGSSAGTMYSGLQAGEFYTPAFSLADPNSSTSVGVMNLGSDSSFAGRKTAQGNQDDNNLGDFAYPVPSGFLAICSKNLPVPEIKLPGEFHSTVLYTGDGVDGRAITGVGFQTDLNWVKKRNATGAHNVVDSVRGPANSFLETNASGAAGTSPATVDSFDSDGFTVSDYANTNQDTKTFVAWNWKAGGAPTATNTGGQTPTSGSVMIDGSASTASLASADIYPEKMSINTTSGFSIISYEGNGSSSQTIPHGLSTAPALIISKGYSTGADYNWRVFGENVGLTSANYSMRLDLTNAENDNSNVFGTYPTSSVWTIGSDAGVNDSGKDYIVYCFSNIEGYSKAGSYEGNSNADGPFIYTGFKPAFVIIKGVDQAGSSWFLLDDERDPYNVVNHEVYADANSAESTGSRALDFVSNGFKSRGNDALNYSSTMIYIAFAESPFKYSNAR